MVNSFFDGYIVLSTHSCVLQCYLLVQSFPAIDRISQCQFSDDGIWKILLCPDTFIHYMLILQFFYQLILWCHITDVFLHASSFIQDNGFDTHQASIAFSLIYVQSFIIKLEVEIFMHCVSSLSLRHSSNSSFDYASCTYLDI